MNKSPDAFRTISEVAEAMDTPAHVLRFWETRFPQIRPVKRAGGRRYYRPADVALLAGIKRLLHEDGLTIRGVQKILREQGVRHVAAIAAPIETTDSAEASLVADPSFGQAPERSETAWDGDSEGDAPEADAPDAAPTPNVITFPAEVLSDAAGDPVESAAPELSRMADITSLAPQGEAFPLQSENLAPLPHEGEVEVEEAPFAMDVAPEPEDFTASVTTLFPTGETAAGAAFTPPEPLGEGFDLAGDDGADRDFPPQDAAFDPETEAETETAPEEAPAAEAAIVAAVTDLDLVPRLPLSILLRKAPLGSLGGTELDLRSLALRLHWLFHRMSQPHGRG